MKIAFLIHNVYGLGGTNRTTINLATALADHHDVEIVSIFRDRDTSLFAIDPRIKVVPLVDTRSEEHATWRETPAEVFPKDETRYRQYSVLCDRKVAAYFEKARPDIAVGTRPGLNVYVAALAGDATLRIGQEHVTLASHPAPLTAELRTHYARLDGFVTVSEADAENYRTEMKIPGLPVVAIPNSVPEPLVRPADGRSRTVVAAGRLAALKRYDDLVRAFAKVAAEHPDWTLRIYGQGGERAKLRSLINELGLCNQVFLMGLASPIEAEWAKGSIAAVTSESESFGMTIVEAMRCGVPVVSTDCPLGPREIIRDGEDGRLVPVGDTDAIAAALLDLIRDEELRTTMGRAALRNAARFDPAVVAERYEELFQKLRTRRAGGPLKRSLRELRRLLKPRPAAKPAPKTAAKPAAKAGTAKSGQAPAKKAVPKTASAALTCLDDLAIEIRPTPASKAADGTVLLERRGEKNATERQDTVVLPLGEGPAPVARLTTHAALREDTWDFHVLRADGTRNRLRSHLLDVRALIEARPPQDASPVVARLPYTTVDGYLALRVRQAPVHAETERIDIGDGRITVTCRVYGATGRVEAAVLTHRAGPAPAIDLPCTAAPDGSVHFTVDAAAPAAHRFAEQDLWDLTLRVAGVEGPVRVGAWFGDVKDRKEVYAYPITVVEETSRGRARVRPYFTVHNDLSVNVVDLPAATG
ncbi:glycosyltransferase family 4 protein [Streptomyces yaizuensis]|uniref:D-inositol 3-phosphate glycosyltransferase n=1 Tax=Streptomyces yaizuensis TaxID=2989713 RepID=A0ABQ5P0W1_9ACTN|nr:glycosyltransferase family 4 protein [Streptomyces sp. YSPA8]GLF96242.1 glycosyltransferase family 4 protein [Streptomyces sp. YSPA8]